MSDRVQELQRLFEWAGNLAEELEALQNAILELAEDEPIPQRCGGGRRVYPDEK